MNIGGYYILLKILEKIVRGSQNDEIIGLQNFLIEYPTLILPFLNQNKNQS